ncbi:hypothetical protein ACTVCO_12040 [Sanguibacter sp. A247]|uniref:hypothetical protein n=1 Tax=unclassified Sanguibacter TaxID=2645534 RepID=UPI003FD7BCEA
MIAVTLLALVATADVLRSGRLPRVVPPAGVVVVAAALVLGVGVDLLTAAAGAVVALAWAAAMSTDGARAGARVWPAVALLVVLAATALVPVASPTGPAVDMWRRSLAGEIGIPAEAALAFVVVALALTRTANLITRAALVRARRTDTVDDAQGLSPSVAEAPERATARGWRLTVRGHEVVHVRADDAPERPRGPVMRGGRLIGPLERQLVLVLGLLGVYPVLAAVLAAKGIVRFPEISADRARGTKAEEFLVGSLVSWTCAGVGVALVQVCLLG